MDHIPLFYWSSKVFESKHQENYGDILAQFIVTKVSGRPVKFFNAPRQRKKWFKKSYLMAIGSIMRYTQPKASVWGSGIISIKDTFANAKFHAVRGPLSRKRILEQGYECPENYGDPALLLPKYYTPDVKKKYKLGFVPHYVDYQRVDNWYKNNPDVIVINLLDDDIFKTTDYITSCEKVISSSLHGVIVAQAYGIPAIWVQFSDKLSGDNIKFADYFESVQIMPYQATVISEQKAVSYYEVLFEAIQSQVDIDVLESIQNNLIQAFPQQYML